MPNFLIVDLFCGAGGTSTGFAMAGRMAKVVACVNHDPIAIESHWKNHKDVIHFEEDIRTLDLTALQLIVKHEKVKHPDALLILWASLECTNFSKAKGGQPREADSRTLAEHLHRYIDAIDPDYVQIENVVEFMSWGPLDENGKPVSRKNGQCWMAWRHSINAKGYHDDWKELNSANFGAYTSRNRLFGCFAKPGLPIVWPNATHTKNPTQGDGLKKWKAVKKVLDFTDEGESIFNRKKPLVDATLERIYAGLVKYVAQGDTAFISKYYSGRPMGKVISVESPAGTITTANGQSLVVPISLIKYNSMGKKGNYAAPSVEDPCPVISCQNRLGIVNASFLQSYYGNGGVHSIDDPAITIPTKDRLALTCPEYFIDKHFGSHAQNSSIDAPAGTLLPNDKHRLVEVTPFLMPTSYSNKPTSIEDPAPTIQASRRHHYIVNPSHGGHSTSTDAPCPVIIARQDKAPLYLVGVQEGPFVIPIYEDDSEVMVRIKTFMAAFGLVDIKMRMLRVNELLRIQGFPNNYVLCGTQTDQKKFIGNSVVPKVVKVWIEAMNDYLKTLKTKAA